MTTVATKPSHCVEPKFTAECTHKRISKCTPEVGLVHRIDVGIHMLATERLIIELRSMDCPSAALGLSAVAFVKGLFYHAPSLKTAWGLVGSWPLRERQRLLQEVPRTALQTKILDTDLRGVSRALCVAAEKGLPADEKKYLRPLQGLLEEGVCPAQRLLACIGHNADRKKVLDQIVRCCEILSP